MESPDVKEATPLVQRLCNNLAGIVSDKGVPGSSARTALGDLAARAEVLLSGDTIGVPLDNAFDLVRQSIVVLYGLENVRKDLMAEAPMTLGATLVRNSSIYLCLAQQSQLIADMTFESRQDVQAVIQQMQPWFDEAEEVAADTMDPMVYRSLVQMRGAVVNHLVVTERPLPEMIGYQFNAALPSLIISQRLYGDASRYDQIRKENKVVHPLFCPPSGRALSF